MFDGWKQIVDVSSDHQCDDLLIRYIGNWTVPNIFAIPQNSVPVCDLANLFEKMTDVYHSYPAPLELVYDLKQPRDVFLR